MTPLDDAPALCRLGVAALTAGYRDGSFSPVEVTTAVLARAAAINPHFNAFTLIDHDGALAAARQSEARWRRGAPVSEVDGVPATIKDIVKVQGWPTSFGSTTSLDMAGEQDAPAVAAWRAAGTVLIGMTTTPEFGWKAVTDSVRWGITRNPWDATLTPGGSSGGAAVAAATGAGVLHLGTDGGGSIRIPAAFTGVAGHKPSFGLVPADPPSAFGTLAHIGPLARDAADAAAGLRAMTRRDLRDWFQWPDPKTAPAQAGLRGLRLGVWRDPPCGALDAGIAAVFDTALRRLETAGAILEPVALPGENLLAIFEILWFSGAANRLAGLPPANIDPGLREIAAIGKNFSAVDYIAAGLRRAAFGAAMDALLSRFDALVSPATAIPPFAAGANVPPGGAATRWHEWAGFSFPLNLSQQPACVVPCGFLDSGMPVAVQFIGPRGGDSKTLAIAGAFAAS